MDDRKLAATLQQAKQFLAEDLIADGATVHPRSSSTSYLIHVAQTRDTDGSRRALARFDAVANSAWQKHVAKHGLTLLPSALLAQRYLWQQAPSRPLTYWQRFRSMIGALWSRVRGR